MRLGAWGAFLAIAGVAFATHRAALLAPAVVFGGLRAVAGKSGRRLPTVVAAQLLVGIGLLAAAALDTKTPALPEVLGGVMCLGTTGALVAHRIWRRRRDSTPRSTSRPDFRSAGRSSG